MSLKLKMVETYPYPNINQTIGMLVPIGLISLPLVAGLDLFAVAAATGLIGRLAETLPNLPLKARA